MRGNAHRQSALPGAAPPCLARGQDSISSGTELLTIARAFLADPGILILDEATSNVDTRTEVMIQDAMTRLRSGRTSFVIAHRLSTIRNAHTIIVMDSGRIAEQGSHEELLNHGGLYHHLYHSQFTEFTPGVPSRVLPVPECAALCTEPGRQATFVREADLAYCLGPASARPYLDLTVLASALVATGADAAWAGWKDRRHPRRKPRLVLGPAA